MTTSPGNLAQALPKEKSRPGLPWISWALLLVAGGLALYPLTYSWNFLADYAFGWWVPVLCLFLFSERWATRPAPVAHNPGIWRFVIGWALLFFFFRMALEVSLGARPILYACTLLYVVAVIYWFWVYGGPAWARHFAFPVCFLLLSVPWLYSIETGLVQNLSRFNAWLVAQVLIELGILAENAGNVIVLPNCTLDVAAACSGIRSLQAALMISFLVGELYRFAWPRRIKIVLLAIVLAMVGNFLRTLFLALLASNYGVKVMEQWHDTAGGSILIFTSVTTWLICHILYLRDSRQLGPIAKRTPQDLILPSGRLALKLACGILVGVLVGEGVTKEWYAWKEGQAVRYPTWTAKLPTTGNFRDLPIPEESRNLLKYDFGRDVEWQDGRNWTWNGYWFRYHPKAWGDSVYIDHNPDACLPASGFDKVADLDPFVAEAHGVRLNVHPKQFSWKGTPVYVFWVVYADRSNFPLDKVVGTPHRGVLNKIRFFFSSIRDGVHASTAETESLELILSGPENYAVARAAYLDELQNIVVPDAGPASLARANANP